MVVDDVVTTCILFLESWPSIWVEVDYDDGEEKTSALEIDNETTLAQWQTPATKHTSEFDNKERRLLCSDPLKVQCYTWK